MVKFEVFGVKSIADQMTIEWEPVDFNLDRIIRILKVPGSFTALKFKTAWILHDIKYDKYYLENHYDDWSYERYTLISVYDQKEGDITEKFKAELHARTNN